MFQKILSSGEHLDRNRTWNTRKALEQMKKRYAHNVHSIVTYQFVVGFKEADGKRKGRRKLLC